MARDNPAPRRIKLPLTALRTFEAAARRLSFKEAAEELGVSATTVSNQIRQIEHDWRCLLFVRKTRQVVLTDAGRSLARVVSRAFEDIRAEVESHVSTLRRSVTLAVGPIFATRWLIPRLSRFYRLHPRIELVLLHGPRITSGEGMTASIAVDWGTGHWAGLEAKHLLDLTYCPVASPAFLKAHGPLRKVTDLARVPIIHQHDRSEWFAWARLAGVPQLRFRQETTILDTNVVVQAAIDGNGVALGPFPFIQSDVDAGRLVRPFPLELKPERSYHLLTRPGARSSPEIRAVCDWIEAEATIG
jgi:LysR family glycine cleavage system transcriptional activator